MKNKKPLDKIFREHVLPGLMKQLKLKKVKAPKTSKIYDTLRSAHSDIKDIIFHEGFHLLSSEKQNAIEALHSVLYLAEGQFTDF